MPTRRVVLREALLKRVEAASVELLFFGVSGLDQALAEGVQEGREREGGGQVHGDESGQALNERACVG